MQLPLRVDVATGERLPPSGLDPYALPWVQGATQTVPGRIRRMYAGQIADLREKLSVLKTTRGKFDPDEPAYGPQLRSSVFQALPTGLDQDDFYERGRALRSGRA